MLKTLLPILLLTLLAVGCLETGGADAALTSPGRTGPIFGPSATLNGRPRARRVPIPRPDAQIPDYGCDTEPPNCVGDWCPVPNPIERIYGDAGPCGD